MRTIFFLLIVLGFRLNAQNPAKLNLKDSCVISGGVISVADFKKVCKVCPEGMKKVNSYIISYTENHIGLDFPLKNNRWNSSFVKNPKLGIIILIEEIKGIDAKGKPMTVPPIVLGLKEKAPVLPGLSNLKD